MKIPKLKIKKERTVLISNKSFMDFSDMAYEKLLNKHPDAPDIVKYIMADIAGDIVTSLYCSLFDIEDSDFDFEEVDVDAG